MTREQIEQRLGEIKAHAAVGDHEAAHCAEIALRRDFVERVATVEIPYGTHRRGTAIYELRELARLVRSSREIVFRRGA